MEFELSKEATVMHWHLGLLIVLRATNMDILHGSGRIGAIVVFRNSNWLYRMVAERLGRVRTELDCFGVSLLFFYGLDELVHMHLSPGLSLIVN